MLLALHLHKGLWAWDVFTERFLSEGGVASSHIHAKHMLQTDLHADSSW